MESLPPLKRKKHQAGWETNKKRLSSQGGNTGRSHSQNELPIAQGTFFVPGFFPGRELSWSAEGKSEIIRELQRNTVTILVGETGSGKTTRELSTRIPVHLPLIHGKRYPSTSSKRVYRAENALRSPSRGGSLLHLLQLVSPRNKEIRWARLSGILSVLTNAAAQAQRSNSSRTECWFGS